MLVAAAPAAGQVRPTIPANWLSYGSTLTWDAWGIVTTAATPGTGLWDIRLGSAVVFTQATAITLAVSAASWPWHIHVDMTVQIQGATTAAKMWGNGYLYLPTSLTAFAAVPIPQTGFAQGAGFDSTVPNVLDSFFTESLGTATFVCQSARAIIQNPNY
jgi:hypothetical protein